MLLFYLLISCVCVKINIGCGHMNTNAKSTVIVAVTIIVMIIAIIGASYAYLAASIGSAVTTQINVISGTIDNLVFIPGSDLTVTANQDNFGSGSGDKSGTITSQVKLTANNYSSSTQYYRAYLVVTDNTFVYTNGTTPELTLTVKRGSTTVINGMDVTTKTGIIDIPVTSGGTALKQSITASAGATTTENWTATVTFVNLNSNQNDNVGKQFRAKLFVVGINKLTDEYQQLEYLVFAGAQRIHTGYYLNQNTDGYAVTFAASTTSQNGMMLADCGSGGCTGSYNWAYYYNAGSRVATYLRTASGAASSSPSTQDTNKHTMRFIEKRSYFDDTNTGNWHTSSFNAPSAEMLVGACYYNSNYNYYFKGNIYEVVFYQNNIIIMDLVPCQRTTDSVYGMCDVINNGFYINGGSGSFTGGPIVN
jgi:hypothetical protein